MVELYLISPPTDTVLLHLVTQYTGEMNEVHERDIEFIFEGNTAPRGNSIYATTVEHCQKIYNCTADPSKLFSYIANFSFPCKSFQPHGPQLTTAGRKFKINNNYKFPLSGKTFQLPIYLLDEFCHHVQSQYNLYLANTKRAFILATYSVLKKNKNT